MAPGPSSRTPLLPGFAPGADAVTSQPGENHHAIQDDRPRTPSGSVSRPARPAPPGADAAGDPGPAGDGAEGRPHGQDERAGPGEPGEEFRPDRDRSPRAGDRGPAAPFTLRVAAGRDGRAAVPRRGDGLPPPSSYAERVSAARARAGQPRLPFIIPACPRARPATAAPEP